MERQQRTEGPNPDPRLVGLLDFALTEIVGRYHPADCGYSFWLDWAREWLSGRHLPQQCVDIAHEAFEIPMIGHTLGQLAWAGKEACYSTPTSGWLVVRYIADAMVAFGIAYPKTGGFPSLDRRSP